MNPFSYNRAKNVEEALALSSAKTSFIAGGTTMLDLMKLNIWQTTELLDISRLDLRKIEKRGDSIFIGALVSNSELAHHKLIQEEFPVLSQAILSGASPQLRNMASTAGNIMQQKRSRFRLCSY
ncbi:MAG: FAD binding domain-containing protein [Candidatus Obscuribacterales bacterium]|nr:FAD binding domain-containing protein [Candidatus Obscuribacterales bacterium]